MRQIQLGKLGLIFIATLLAATSALAQCKSEITMVPLPARRTTRSDDAHIPRGDFIRYTYQLSPTDKLLIYGHEDSEDTLGPHDRSLVVTHNDSIVQQVLLRKLPEMLHDPDRADNFSTLSITRACNGNTPIYFAAMGYDGDATSGDLFFTVAPTVSGYQISALPITSGGILDVSRTNPLTIKTWSNMNEGECNACPTRYLVTEYAIQEGRPVETLHYLTRHLYSSGQFDDRRRVALFHSQKRME